MYNLSETFSNPAMCNNILFWTHLVWYIYFTIIVCRDHDNIYNRFFSVKLTRVVSVVSSLSQKYGGMYIDWRKVEQPWWVYIFFILYVDMEGRVGSIGKGGWGKWREKKSGGYVKTKHIKLTSSRSTKTLLPLAFFQHARLLEGIELDSGLGDVQRYGSVDFHLYNRQCWLGWQSKEQK